MVLFNTIDIYTAIMLNWLSVTCVAQWVEHVNISLMFLSSALLVRILHATFIIVTIEKTMVLFYLNFLLLQYLFSVLINLISLVTTTFSSRIRNTVLQLSPVIS